MENYSLDNNFTETSHAYHRFLHREFQKLDLHRGQPRLLARLWKEDGLSQNELAKKLKISNPTLTKMINSLESSGYIIRKRDSQDKRVTRIYLSEKGRQSKRQLELKFKEIETILFSDFSGAELQIFNALLLKIHRRVDEEMKIETDI